MNWKLVEGQLHSVEDCKEPHYGQFSGFKWRPGDYETLTYGEWVPCDCKDGKILVEHKNEKPDYLNSKYQLVSDGELLFDSDTYQNDKEAYQEQTRLSTLLTEALKVEKPRPYGLREFRYTSLTTWQIKMNVWKEAQQTLNSYKAVNGIITNLK